MPTHNLLINDPITRHIIQYGNLIIDGALATELEKKGCDLTDSLWSAKILIENPELIYQVHLDYFRAGAECAITASYQATPQGFSSRGLTEQQSRDLIKKSVRLAQKARSDFLLERHTEIPLLVAGSVGPYGAFLADGSEYRGDYKLSQEDMMAFHRPRIEALVEAGVDLLACETLPSLAEIVALIAILKEFPQISAWFSFTLLDSEHLSDGTPLAKVVSLLNEEPQVVSLGINCIAVDKVTDALTHLQSLTDKPLLAYPNSGEHYDAQTKTWHSCEDANANITTQLFEWQAAGACLLGGCCRTTPKDIAQISAQLRKLT